MTEVKKRHEFVKDMREYQIKLDKLDEVEEQAKAAGGSVDQLKAADLDGDGRIAGDSEMQRLFDIADSFDGRRDGVAAKGSQVHDLVDQLDGYGVRERRVYADKAYRRKFTDARRDLRYDVGQLRQLVMEDASIRAAAEREGISLRSFADDLVRADLDGDGDIEGPGEMNALFSRIDGKYDHDGNADTFDKEDAQGRPTLTGAAHSQLALIAENRPGATPSSRAVAGKQLAEWGSQNVHDKVRAHWKQIDELGFGTHYGSNSSFNVKSVKRGDKYVTEAQGWDYQVKWVKEKLKAKGLPESSYRQYMPRRSSCIEWAMENIEDVYKKAGMGARWEQIRSKVVANKGLGIVLAKELQKDGWESVLLSKDTQNIDELDDTLALHRGDLEKGLREGIYPSMQVNLGGSNYNLQIDHYATDYAPTAGRGTQQDPMGLAKLGKVPFGFVLLKRGHHTGIMYNGNRDPELKGKEPIFSENHYGGDPTSKSLFEESPLGDTIYSSGVIMIPPGTWPKDADVSAEDLQRIRDAFGRKEPAATDPSETPSSPGAGPGSFHNV